MQRALVIRTYGNPEMSAAMKNALESQELRKLRAELGVHRPVRSAMYARKVAEARKKYYVKPVTGVHEKLLGLAGMVVLIANEFKRR